MEGTTFVGLDAHKDWISVALLVPGRETAVEWRIPNEAGALKKMLRRVAQESPGAVRFCYEAGPCGYALQRQITTWSEASCMVVAPSLIPGKPGERIKTDRRDAKKLAFLFRAGLLTEVQPPSEEDEAARDLCRAREDAREDLVRGRHRLTKFLLRRGHVFTAGTRAWTKAHRQWLQGMRLEQVWDQVVFADYLHGIEHLEGRLALLADKLEELSRESRYAVPVGMLRCFRGLDTVAATSIVVELHTFHRFPSARKLMAFVGLVSSEHSSGQRRRLGAITKSGNSHDRRLLIESAWSYRHPPRVGVLAQRRNGQPQRVIALADRAMQRLYRRYVRLTARGVPSQKAVVALARELVGFIWAALSPLATASEMAQAD
jgi:transposase